MNIFENKTAFVTGGASGIGKALATELAKRGALVTIADVNEKLIAEVVISFEQQGYKVKGVRLDVTDRDAVKEAIEDIVKAHGHLDYVFNNAGISLIGEAQFYIYDDWKKIIDINLYGCINGVFTAYPIMVKQGYGHIINTASIAGLVAWPGEASYSASKYGIVGLSYELRAEGSDMGVNVSVVCPGKVETPIYMTTKAINLNREEGLKHRKPGVSPEKCADIILRGVKKNKQTIIVGGPAKFFWMLHRISHSLSFLMRRFGVRKMRTFRLVEKP